MNENTLNKLKPFIYGKMLGDATIERAAKSTFNSKFRVKQQAAHKEYVEQCWRKMHNHSGQMYLSGSARTYKGITKTHYAWVFKSKANPIWNRLRDQWYNSDGSKRLPDDLEEYFTPELLAYWFMDDGYTQIQGKFIIATFSTQSFSESQVEYLIHLLNSKYNLNAKKTKDRLDKSGVQRFLIQIPRVENVSKFIELIKSFINPCLLYKIRIP